MDWLLNVLSIVFGGAIGLWFTKFKWVVGVPILLGFAVNAVFDFISYHDPLVHPLAIILDSVGFLFWAVISFWLKRFITKTNEKAQAAERSAP
jgi:hypothetical protein